MQVRFLRGTALGGVGNDAYPGDIRDLPLQRAMELIAMGRAVEQAARAEQPAIDQTQSAGAKAGGMGRLSRKGK